MGKTEIKSNIEGLLECTISSLRKECLNEIPDKKLFICINIEKENCCITYRDAIKYLIGNEELIDFNLLCDYVYETQSKINWIDICPYKIDDNGIIFIVKIVKTGENRQEIGYHVTLPYYNHYPILGGKYDLNYFWQVSDKDYKEREEKWRRESQRILRKYEFQKWFVLWVQKYFGIQMKTMDLDEEMKKINVF